MGGAARQVEEGSFAGNETGRFLSRVPDPKAHPAPGRPQDGGCPGVRAAEQRPQHGNFITFTLLKLHAKSLSWSVVLTWAGAASLIGA